MSKLKSVAPVMTKCGADDEIFAAKSIIENTNSVLGLAEAAILSNRASQGDIGGMLSMLREQLGYALDSLMAAQKEIQKIDPPHEMTDEEVEAYLNRETRAAS